MVRLKDVLDVLGGSDELLNSVSTRAMIQLLDDYCSDLIIMNSAI